MKKSRISKRNRKYPNGNYWMREDMGVFGFAWTLLLIGTVAAAETDRPVLWLLVGPVPFVVGFAVVAFLRKNRLPVSQWSAVRTENEGRVPMEPG